MRKQAEYILYDKLEKTVIMDRRTDESYIF